MLKKLSNGGYIWVHEKKAAVNWKPVILVIVMFIVLYALASNDDIKTMMTHSHASIQNLGR